MKIGLVPIFTEHKELRWAYNNQKTRESAQQAEEAGVEQVMLQLLPYKPAAIRKFEQALHIYHQFQICKGKKGNLIGIDSDRWLYLASKAMN